MKKLMIASLSLFAAMTANAAPIDVQLTTSAVAGIAAGSEVNTSQDLNILAVANRAGFVKNDFGVTVSANMAVSVHDDGDDFAVAAGSDRGRGAYTGHSDGGSVTQCGELVASTVEGGAATVVASRLVIANINACSETPRT